MANKKGSALMMVWVDVPADVEDEFNKWYNEEHIAERLAVPGFLSAARYEAVKSGPKHLAMYEIENADVLNSPEYMKVRNNPSEWTKRMSPDVVGTTYIRNVYEMIHPEKVTAEIAQSGMAPALQIGRMDIPAGIESDWNEWYNTVYIPNYEKVPGVVRGRRYRAVVGKPDYLTVYEFDHEKVSESPEWATQQNINPMNAKMRQVMQHVPGSPGVWKKTFELKS
jgi:hypothetical protein